MGSLAGKKRLSFLCRPPSLGPKKLPELGKNWPRRLGSFGGRQAN